MGAKYKLILPKDVTFFNGYDFPLYISPLKTVIKKLSSLEEGMVVTESAQIHNGLKALKTYICLFHNLNLVNVSKCLS